MNKSILTALTEDELDVLVSIAIRRAEVLDESNSPAANDAWREVMMYEERLARMTSAAEIPGGIARLGAVTSALAAGEREKAAELAEQYLMEESLPKERRHAIQRALDEYKDSLAKRFPSLSKNGRLAELDKWRARARQMPSVFPLAA